MKNNRPEPTKYDRAKYEKKIKIYIYILTETIHIINIGISKTSEN